MSKERALRRAERAAALEKAATTRARSQQAAARRRARLDRYRGWLPGRRPSGSRGRSRAATGVLAAKRRRTVGLVVVTFLVMQFLTWVATPDWGVRLAVFVACLFAVPVLAALTR